MSGTHMLVGASRFLPRRGAASQDCCPPSTTLQCGRPELTGEGHQNCQPYSVFLQKKHPLHCPRHCATLMGENPFNSPLPRHTGAQLLNPWAMSAWEIAVITFASGFWLLLAVKQSWGDDDRERDIGLDAKHC